VPEQSKPEINPEDIDTSPTGLGEDKPSDQEFVELKERFNQVSNEKTELQAENEQLKTRNASLERNVTTNAILDGLIVPFATKIFWFMCVYCGFVGCVLIYAIRYDVPLGRAIEILVGSTAITVIGLVGTIVAGIFAGARRGSN
jgi:hypothetical protein